jgi:hypothetical protein
MPDLPEVLMAVDDHVVIADCQVPIADFRISQLVAQNPNFPSNTKPYLGRNRKSAIGNFSTSLPLVSPRVSFHDPAAAHHRTRVQ